eukprot:2703679-Prymnesium_polylepis.1
MSNELGRDRAAKPGCFGQGSERSPDPPVMAAPPPAPALPPASLGHHSIVYRCCIHHHFRFAIPAATLEPVSIYSAADNRFSGYMADYIELIQSEMGFSKEIIPVPVDTGALEAPHVDVSA